MPGPAWSTQQLAEFLAVVSSAETEAAAARAAVERAAEALDAAVGAIVCGGGAAAAAGVPRGAPPVADESAAADVFTGVVEEAVRLLRGEAGALVRYEPDGTVAVVAGWGDAPIPVGTCIRLDGESVTAMVLRSGGPARVDSFEGLSGSIAGFVRQHGLRSSVGAPVVVDGRVWGALLASSTGAEPLPPDSEQRLAGFTELVGTAISNAQARGEL